MRQRWRIINAARSRFFQLEVAGHPLTRIGGDGGLLEAPAAAVDRLLLVPGERAEVSVVLPAAAGERLAVRALAHERGGARDRGPMGWAARRHVPEYCGDEGADAGPALPAALRSSSGWSRRRASPSSRSGSASGRRAS